ncbi:MAG: transposase [Bacteroidota bacterium]|nr:transposase [Bacteroidota bacterium]
MKDKFKNKYRISSARLRTWDYSCDGFYFITICTKNREQYFGEIENEVMYLNELGLIAHNCWEEIPEHFKYVELGEFVIIPNHVHGIIIIQNPDIDKQNTNSAIETRHSVETRYSVETRHSLETRHILKTRHSLKTRHALSLQNQNQEQIEIQKNHFRFRNQGKNTVSAIVGSYKSAVTKLRNRLNKPKVEFGWQSRFHDHIIRSYEEYVRISEYIMNNPTNWRENEFYS